MAERPVVAPQPYVVHEQTYHVVTVDQAQNKALPEILILIHKAFMECADMDAEVIVRLRRRGP